MTILVTGGAGFIGSNLVRTLQSARPEARIVVIDDFRSGTFANLSCERLSEAEANAEVPDEASTASPKTCGGCESFSFAGQVIARPLHELDLEAVIQRFDPEIIFHEASITDTRVTDEAKMIAENVEPFETLLAIAVKRGCKLVWASSAATYGRHANGAAAQRRPFRLEDAGHPANVYGFSKWIMENLHRQMQRRHPRAHIVGLRYFNVFGPGETHKGPMASMVHQLACQMLNGQRPRIFHDGEQARDQVFVRDVVECTIAAAHENARYGIYNLGSGAATSFNQIVASLNEALGTDLEPEYFDNPFPFYQDFTCAELTETRAALNWTPRYSAHQGIFEYARTLRSDVPTCDAR